MRCDPKFIKENIYGRGVQDTKAAFSGSCICYNKSEVFDNHESCLLQVYLNVMNIVIVTQQYKRQFNKQ